MLYFLPLFEWEPDQSSIMGRIDRNGKIWTKKNFSSFSHNFSSWFLKINIWKLHRHDHECTAILCPAVCVSDVTNMTRSALQFCFQHLYSDVINMTTSALQFCAQQSIHQWCHKHDHECIVILCPAVCVSDVINKDGVCGTSGKNVPSWQKGEKRMFCTEQSNDACRRKYLQFFYVFGTTCVFGSIPI